MLELKNISKSYTEGNTKHRVLNTLELNVSKGEIIILLGKSGTGKSTLLNIISGIDVPDSPVFTPVNLMFTTYAGWPLYWYCPGSSWPFLVILITARAGSDTPSGTAAVSTPGGRQRLCFPSTLAQP